MNAILLRQPLPKGALEKCAELYCAIWREPPWNEEFWKPEDVLQDLAKELAEPFAQIVLASTEKEVIGFTWGYRVSKEEMAEISGNNQLDYLFTRNAWIFYVDELGVESNFRQRGIGEKLSRELLCLARKDGANLALLRTDVLAKSARILYEKLGFQELLARDKKYPDRSYWMLAI